MVSLAATVLSLAGACMPGQFVDTFTDNNFTQANWTFKSPYQCANPILGPAYGIYFSTSGIAGGGKICLSVPVAVPAALGGPAPSYGMAYPTDQVFTGDVAVYAGVTFTAQELNDTRAGTRRVVKALLIRFDPRPAGTNVSLGQFPTCANTDGGEAYFLNLDPASGSVDTEGGNDFSIRRMDNAFNDHEVALHGFVYQPDVHYNIYFAAKWDAAANTNHLRAILYLDDLAQPLVDLQIDEGTIKPGNVDPSNTNNNYVAVVVDDQSGHSVGSMCMDVNTKAICQAPTNAFIATTQLLPDGLTVDTDADGVPDLCDQCPGTLVGVTVDTHGCPSPPIPGDCELNGDVSQADYLFLLACFTGPKVTPTLPNCLHADFTGDGLVDQSDFGIWQRCFSGAGVIGNPNCAGQ